MVKNEGKGRKMTGFQRHQKIVVLMDILKPAETGTLLYHSFLKKTPRNDVGYFSELPCFFDLVFS